MFLVETCFYRSSQEKTIILQSRITVLTIQEAAQSALKTAQDHHRQMARDLKKTLDAEVAARMAAEGKIKQLHKRVHAWKEG